MSRASQFFKRISFPMEVRKNRNPTAISNDLKRECREEEQETNRIFVSKGTEMPVMDSVLYTQNATKSNRRMIIYSLEFRADHLVMLLVPIASPVKISTSRPRHEVVHNRVVFFEVLQT